MNKLYEELIRLQKIEPELVVTGSLSLYWHNMLNRIPTDLDIIVPVISNSYEHDPELLKNIQFFVEDQDLSKEILNSDLLDYLKTQNDIKDRTEAESDPLDVAFSCVNKDNIKIDVFPMIKSEVDILIKIITVDNVQYEIKYNDWPNIIPYKIKYFKGNPKHFNDFKFIKKQIDERIEHAEDYGFGLVEGSKESKAYHQLDQVLDDMSLDKDIKLVF